MASGKAAIEQDLDPEALHDFRVALRRCRTLLNAFGDPFDRRLSTRCRAGLRWLTRRTGARRDLDVALRDLRDLDQHGDLTAPTVAQLEKSLRRERAREQRRLLACLSSARYRELNVGIEQLLTAMTAAPENAAADTAIAPHDALHRAGRKLRRRARHAAKDVSIARLHAVRKAGKRLRYLLEALPELSPQRNTKRAMKQASECLKAMQDMLGAVCDLGVQAELLDRWGALFDQDHANAQARDLGLLRDRVRERAADAAAQAAAKLTEYTAPFDREFVSRILPR